MDLTPMPVPPCIVWNGLVIGYKDTVFLTSVQGQSDLQIFAALVFLLVIKDKVAEKSIL